MQRVAIMRALLLDPEVLLLDEPLSALDPLVRSELRDDLRGIFRSLGKTVIVVTHDVGEAAHLADVVVLMRDGRVVQQGPFATLAAAPADPFVAAFLATGNGDAARPSRGDDGAARAAVAMRWRWLSACGGGGRTAATSSSASKAFTESVILGEMAAALARGAGGAVEHRRQLGGTEVVFRALETGAVDVYPGIHRDADARDPARRDGARRAPLADVLAAHGLRASRPLGFDNNYALAMTEARAAALGIRRISDLRAHPELRVVLSNEVMSRADGWPGLRAAYGLPHEARGMDHDLAYRALASGGADVTDVYTTDAEIRAYGLRVLDDDRRFFAALRGAVRCTAPTSRRARPPSSRRSSACKAASTTPTMIALNARAKLDRVPESEVAAEFLAAHVGGAVIAAPRERVLATIAGRAAEHTALVGAVAAGRDRRSPSRSASSPRAARASAASSSAPPACCRPSRRWRCWCC